MSLEIKSDETVSIDIFQNGTKFVEKLSMDADNDYIRNHAHTRRRFETNQHNKAVHMDEEYAKVDRVPGLKTSLYRHQQTAVRAMYDLENTDKIKLNGGDKIEFNAAVLSEPVGSGKTIDILSLICLQKIPNARPDIIEMPKFTVNNKNAHFNIGFIKCTYKNLLTPTIIFVGSSVMIQWGEAIKTFTNLSYFPVNDVFGLRKLFAMIENGTVNNYDIILVKNGKVTVPVTLPFNLPLEPKNRNVTTYIYNLISNIRHLCWARVVVDDFDTIGLPNDAGIVHSLFTWFISSTRKNMIGKKPLGRQHTSTETLIECINYSCGSIMNNNYLFYILNVCNETEFIKSVITIPSIKYHAICLPNANNGYISMLASMGDSEINRITEMLNADAHERAAEAAGIKSTSVVDLFQKILGNKFSQYRFAGDLLSFIDYQQSRENERKGYAEYAEELQEQIEELKVTIPLKVFNNIDDKILEKDETKLNPTDLTCYRIAALKKQLTYTKKRLLAFDDIEYKYPGVNQLLNNTKDEYTEIKNQNGIAIQRLKDNIRHGKCAICDCGLDKQGNADVIVSKCCGAVFCAECGIKGQNLHDRHNRLQTGRCGACRYSPLSIKDLIYIGDNFDIDNITEEKFEDDNVPVEKPKEVEKKKKETTKYTSVIDIINNEVENNNGSSNNGGKNHIRLDMSIPNMMKGAGYAVEPKKRKVLIFANYDESLDKVTTELKTENITFWRLGGTLHEINTTATTFNKYNDTCALLINSTKHCSGLNLQTATDLVYLHVIVDQAVESQVAGRGHRLGRKTPLNIWYIIYENELDHLKAVHSAREMSPGEIEHERKMEQGLEKTTMEEVEENAKTTKKGKKGKKTESKNRNDDNINSGNSSNDENEDDNYNDNNTTNTNNATSTMDITKWIDDDDDEEPLQPPPIAKKVRKM